MDKIIIEMPNEVYEDADWMHDLPGYESEKEITDLLVSSNQSKLKHLQGKHDQKLHGAWAGNKSSETSLVKLSGSVRVPTVEEVAKQKERELGVSSEKIIRMINGGAYQPKELDQREILKSEVSKKFPGVDHEIHRNISDPDLIVVAEVIKNLPEFVGDDIQFRLNDKDTTMGASKFGTSGVYEPKKPKENGYIELNLQSDNTPERKAWAVAHEYGHTASIGAFGEKSRVLKDPELLTMLGFGDKKTFPEGFEKNGLPKSRGDGYHSVRNNLNHYMGEQGPSHYVVRWDTTPWTVYGHTHPEEAFAEAFAGYMVSPKALKRDRPMLYNYMKENVFGGLEYDGYSDEPPKLNF